MPHSTTAGIAGLVVASCVTITCARPVIYNQPDIPNANPSVPLAELWNEPHNLLSRNLLWGSGTQTAAPSPQVEYKVEKVDESGYSSGYDVVGPDGREWDIKIGMEAQTEVVLSRILWALGYHQPQTYYLTGWKLEGTFKDEGAPARFRLESDHENDGEWKWLENPFIDTRPFRALIAVNLLLSNWDFKTSNNRVYRSREPGGEPARRYVVQDLGASLGKPRAFPVPIGTRNEIEDFEETTLIKEVRGVEVSLNYRGLRGEILESLQVADVVWACELLNQLRDPQLDDAFEAAGYEPDIRRRFIRKIRAKIDEGLALRSAFKASAKD